MYMWQSRIDNDRRAAVERCGKRRMVRPLRRLMLESQTGWAHRLRFRSGKPAAVAPKPLQRPYSISGPAESWITDIIQIGTLEGRPCIGQRCSMGSRDIWLAGR